SYYVTAYDYHKDLHSFPTRRSSDLSCSQRKRKLRADRMLNKEKVMKQITLAIFVMVLGSFVLADAAWAEGREWKVITVELAPGTADARHIQPGVELV